MTALTAFLNTGAVFLLCLVVLPILAGLAVWLLKKRYAAQLTAALLAGAANLLFALALFFGGADVRIPFAGFGFDLHFLVSGLSAAVLLVAAAVTLPVVLYSVSYFKGSKQGGLYLLFYFVSIGFVNGAITADALEILAAFWEGLLGCMTVMLLAGSVTKPRAALKMLWICAVSDLLFMFGVIVTIHVSGQTQLSAIERLPVAGEGALGCVLLLLGAMGKAGVMPFYSWIPTAAEDGPTPFLAAFPGSLGSILGGYLLLRVVTKVYAVAPGSAVSVFLLAVGAATLLLAGMMALHQKNLKRLLAYAAIGQAGTLFLGVGTGLAAGAAGGLFQMINHAAVTSGLFILAGAVELKMGTTDLDHIGGLGKKAPVLGSCYLLSGLSMIGFPGFAGFFSKELLFGAALEAGVGWFVAAMIGVFLTAVLFFKVGASLFFGPLKLPSGQRNVRRTNAGMIVSASALALFALLPGVFGGWVQRMFVEPALNLGESFAGWPKSALLVILLLAALALAALDFALGRKKAGSALKCADHLTNLPLVKPLLAAADAGKLDPYNGLVSAVDGFSAVCQKIEDGVSWFYDKGVPGAVSGLGGALHRIVNGSLTRYLVMAIAGVAFILLIYLVVML